MRRPARPIVATDPLGVHLLVGDISGAPDVEYADVSIAGVVYTNVPLLASRHALADGNRVLVASAGGELTILGKLGEQNGVLPAAPAETTGRDGFPDGVTHYTATTGGGWPTNGVLEVLNYPTTGRSIQRLTSASTGATDAPHVYTRQWGSGSAWTQWTLNGPPMRHQSLVVTTTVLVADTGFSEDDTLARLSVTAPPSGLAMCTFGCRVTSNVAGGDTWMTAQVWNVTDGVEHIAISDDRVAKVIQISGSNEGANEHTFPITGMTRGKVYQVRPQYRSDGNTSTFHTRWVNIIPSP